MAVHKIDAPSGAKQKRSRRPKPERHRWLDQWMIAKGALRPLVQRTIAFLDHDEEHRKLRRRVRRPKDLTNHHASVDIVVSNLAYAILMPPKTGRLAVRVGSQRKGMTRYDNRALGPKPFRKLIDQLNELGFLSMRRSERRLEVSSVAVCALFTNKVHEASITLADFDRLPDEETIFLTRNTRAAANAAKRITERERINYRDTAETRAYRAEIRELNSFLASAEIAFIDDGLEPRVDPFDRRLRRHFAILPGQQVRFDQVGRLSGGFWHNLKSERRNGIRIKGEPVATLDYGAMFTRLAYARLKSTPPEGDPYTIEGFEGYRSGIKKAMNCFLFDNTPRRSKWPNDIGVGVGDDDEANDKTSEAARFEGRLPEGWTVGRAKKVILRKHPALKEAWGRSLGYALMFDESCILLAVLNELRTKGIPALSLHDGLMVQRSKRDIAKQAMEAVAERITGLQIPVGFKT
jgi:hypothetical protein